MGTEKIDRELRPGEMASRVGVDRKTITRWIDDGLLEGYRTANTLKRGGERRVLESVFRAFVKKHGLKDNSAKS